MKTCHRISFLAFLALLATQARTAPQFHPEVITPDLGGRTAIADIDGDGFNDIALHVWGSDRGKVTDGKIIWYRYPDWTPTTVVSERHLFGDQIIAHDLDGDGDMDLLGAAGDDATADLWWYENDGNGISWTEHHFGLSGTKSEIKDLEIHDMDGDGRDDVVSRLKKEIVIWYQEASGGYLRTSQAINEREGMGIADLDGDEDADLVLNGYWLENPGERLATWERYDIDPRFFQPGTQPQEGARWRDYSVRVQFEDINGDGEKNLILCHAEHVGFPVVWYTTENPRGGPESWTAHEVGVVDYAHTLHAADLDQDGDIDLLAAGTRHDPESRVTLFYNQGEGSFTRTSIADSTPVYAAALGDIDNDGDLDLVSSYSWDQAPLKVWRNDLIDHRAADGWERRLVDAELPHRAVFVSVADLNGDGQPDPIAGGYWYEATGRFEYTRHEIGTNFGNYAHHGDFDDDGDIDLFGLEGTPWGNTPYWAENDGKGEFTIHSNLMKSSGDFLQGVAEFKDMQGRRLIALSWHGESTSTDALVVPGDPTLETWEVIQLSDFTLNEALSAADIDLDGDIDLVMGNRWLQQNPTGWLPRSFGQGDPRTFEPSIIPDRQGLGDFDRDGDLDVGIGLEEGIDIIVYKNPGPTNADLWEKAVIGHVPGQGFSLDTGDVDGDGDPDIVVGEHRGMNKINHVYMFENAGDQWRRHLIDRGRGDIDHHDGTILRDLDGDGDLDMVSIGWYFPKLWVFENKGNAGIPRDNANQ